MKFFTRIFSALLILSPVLGNTAEISPLPDIHRLTELPPEQCLESLDAVVAQATNEPNNLARYKNYFQALETPCPSLPQIAHNLGVIAAREARWPDAIKNFQRSLNQDTRASDTYHSLRRIFEHRAAEAYSRALNTTIDTPAPEFQWQKSTDVNAQAMSNNAQPDGLRSISTLEYEMYAWWQALHSSIAVEEHYVKGYPREAIRLTQKRYAKHEWATMQRETALTTKDAVVVLSDQHHNRTLFLLKLVGTRWKIYQETIL